MPLLYQNVEIPGEHIKYKTYAGKKSKFWNEGKWNNFIVPMLPPQSECKDGVLVDLGCNAGIFLVEALKYGFRQVVGVENDPFTLDCARKYQEANNLNYTILDRTIGMDFDLKELPVADVVIMSNLHYHLEIEECIHLINDLRYRTRYCIVIAGSTKRLDRYWKAHGELDHTKRYFQYWDFVDSFIVPTEDDPKPRHLYAALFKGAVVRRKLDELEPLTETKWSTTKTLGWMAQQIAEAKQEDFDFKNTQHYRAQQRRAKQSRFTPEQMHNKVETQVNLMYDVKKNGMKNPVIIRKPNRLCDGLHRALMLKALGCESVLALEH